MIWKLAVLSILRRPLRYLLLLCFIALAAALPVYIIQLTAGLYNGLNRAVEPFPLVAGAKGSQYQLVLNTVFLRDRPIGNIPYSEVEALRASGHVSQAIPLGFGDNYRGFRIVGTEPDIFRYGEDKTSGAWLRVAEGRPFSGVREAVIGSETARLTGLGVGDTFESVHGLAGNGAGRAHGKPCKVTGILAPVGGPYDTALLVNLQDIWGAHRGGEAGGEGRTGAWNTREKGDVTAVLVQPRGYADAMKLLAQYQRLNRDVQMVLPAQSVISLYSMMGQSREFWQFLTVGLMAAAVLMTLLMTYWSGLSRLKEFALLRALGAGSGFLYRLMAAEQFCILFAGSAAGWFLGWGVSFLTAHAVFSRASIVMTVSPEIWGVLPPAVILLAGTAAGLVPSWLVRKKDVSGYL